MGLWEPGKLEFSVRQLERICREAAYDHGVTSPSQWASVTINELTHMPADHPDNQFDRVSNAKNEREVFYYGGRAYRVTRWIAADRWTCEAVSYPDTSVSPRPDILNLDQTRLFHLLPDATNPFVALVEVTYNEKGHRAGYGVRRDGALSCFYD